MLTLRYSCYQYNIAFPLLILYYNCYHCIYIVTSMLSFFKLYFHCYLYVIIVIITFLLLPLCCDCYHYDIIISIMLLCHCYSYVILVTYMISFLHMLSLLPLYNYYHSVFIVTISFWLPLLYYCHHCTPIVRIMSSLLPWCCHCYHCYHHISIVTFMLSLLELHFH